MMQSDVKDVPCFSCTVLTTDDVTVPCLECKVAHYICIVCLNDGLNAGIVAWVEGRGFSLRSCTLPLGIGRVLSGETGR